MTTPAPPPPPPPHTPGRLTAGLDLPEVANNNPDPRLIWSGSMQVADCRTPWISQDQSEANARRLVALWNACEHVPTAALEAGAIEGLIDLIRRYRETYDADTLYDEAGALLAQVAGQEGNRG
jgi:hypothetical protein